MVQLLKIYRHSEFKIILHSFHNCNISSMLYWFRCYILDFSFCREQYQLNSLI